MEEMMISEPLVDKLIRAVKEQGARVDEIEQVFYIQEGTIPTRQMTALRSLGYKGQFEIR